MITFGQRSGACIGDVGRPKCFDDILQEDGGQGVETGRDGGQRGAADAGDEETRQPGKGWREHVHDVEWSQLIRFVDHTCKKGLAHLWKKEVDEYRDGRTDSTGKNSDIGVDVREVTSLGVGLEVVSVSCWSERWEKKYVNV